MRHHALNFSSLKFQTTRPKFPIAILSVAMAVSWECFTEFKQWSPFSVSQSEKIEELYQEMLNDGQVKSFVYSYSKDPESEATAEGGSNNPAGSGTAKRQRRQPIEYKVILVPQSDSHRVLCRELLPGGADEVQAVQIRAHTAVKKVTSRKCRRVAVQLQTGAGE